MSGGLMPFFVQGHACGQLLKEPSYDARAVVRRAILAKPHNAAAS
jgi:hypothetical protein